MSIAVTVTVEVALPSAAIWVGLAVKLELLKLRAFGSTKVSVAVLAFEIVILLTVAVNSTDPGEDDFTLNVTTPLAFVVPGLLPPIVNPPLRVVEGFRVTDCPAIGALLVSLTITVTVAISELFASTCVGATLIEEFVALGGGSGGVTTVGSCDVLFVMVASLEIPLTRAVLVNVPAVE